MRSNNLFFENVNIGMLIDLSDICNVRGIRPEKRVCPELMEPGNASDFFRWSFFMYFSSLLFG
ncbi:MAG: hypothetical protein CSA26_07115 [Desulfobacterales bacterium]|nr:MAG: hypothetical protein CSA26_07115 [Desulfobacterales bacterium]